MGSVFGYESDRVARRDVMNMAENIARSENAEVFKYVPNKGRSLKEPSSLEEFQRCVKDSTWQPSHQGTRHAKDIWSMFEQDGVRRVHCSRTEDDVDIWMVQVCDADVLRKANEKYAEEARQEAARFKRTRKIP